MMRHNYLIPLSPLPAQGATAKILTTLHEAIMHELLHLKVPNHGKMLKAIEKTYLEGKNISL